MVVREGYEDHHVVFADPQKLRPYINVLLSELPHIAEKRQDAVEGFAEAAINAEGCTVPGPHENPLPLPLIHYRPELPSSLAFADGITRTALLIELGASFVPVQVEKKDVGEFHRLFGTSRAPEPISNFVVSDQTRVALMTSYRP